MQTILILSIIIILITGCSNMIQSGAIVDAQNAINNNNYAEALENTNIAESFGEPSKVSAAKLYYLKAQSLEGLGRIVEARNNYRYVIKQHNNSPYSELSQKRIDALNALSTN